MKISLIVLLLATALACRSHHVDEAELGGFSVVIERTACFGTCPVYRVSVDGGGAIEYVGLQDVAVLGVHTSRVPAADAQALAQEAVDIDFFSLKDRYDAVMHWNGRETVTDLPTCRVTVTLGGRTKTVEDYYGTPESLRAFEAHVESVARCTELVG